MRTPVLAVAAILAFGMLSAPSAQQPQQSMAKGGEDETGPYEVVKGWPQPWSPTGFIWGSQPGILAESPDRVFIVERGEIKLPDKPMGRGFNGTWGSTGERASVPKPEVHNCIVVIDHTGKMVESSMLWIV